MVDHIHLLVSIPPKISVSSFMGYLKGKSALMIFDRHANLKYKYGNRYFWARGYYESTVAELYRREGIAQSLNYKWSKEFPEAGNQRLAGIQFSLILLWGPMSALQSPQPPQIESTLTPPTNDAAV